MSLILLTAPTAEPLSLAEAKLQLHQDDTADDAAIAPLIRSSREKVESDTRRQLVTATWQLRLDRFPAVNRWHNPFAAIDLRICPAVAVNSVKYLDTAGATQTLAAIKYTIDLQSEPARIKPLCGTTWPSTYDDANAVTVEFVAGLATPFTADAGADAFVASGRTFAVGDKLRLLNSGGALPAPLALLTDYYVLAGSQLSLTVGGAAINITDAGSGTNFLLTDPRNIFETCRDAMRFFIEAKYDRDPEMMEKLTTAGDNTLITAGWGGYV